MGATRPEHAFVSVPAHAGKKYDSGKPRPSLLPVDVLLRACPGPMSTEACIVDFVAQEKWDDLLLFVRRKLAPSGKGSYFGFLPIAAALTYGAEKYGQDNWQGVEAPRYVDAFWRHYIAFCDGEESDPESGLPHLAHAGACLVFLSHKKAAQK